MKSGDSAGARVSAKEVASALQVTARAVKKRAAREVWKYQEKTCRGGKNRMYLVDALPSEVQAKLLINGSQYPAPGISLPVAGVSPVASIPLAAGVFSSHDRAALWAAFDRKPEKQKTAARQRLAAIDAALTLINHDVPRKTAFAEAAGAHGFSAASVYRWYRDARDHDRADWLPLLAPGHAGRTVVAECSPEAWDYFKADYLRPERPASAACYDRLQRAAREHGWTVPALRTIERRIDREIPRAVMLLAREGADALKRAYPAQERDHSVFHALEGVNADGHKFDNFVKWPDGEVGRPCLVGWQDLLSGKILSRRVDKTENTDAVRLSFGDVVERYGVPNHAWLDNGRAWASKWMTGGLKNRYRFKVLDEEPVGILTAMLGKENVHWTTPYHGQAKPIERAWRDFCEYVAKHPALAGSYTGNNPTAKPENYGSRAVPIELFMTILDQEIAAHNARIGRRSAVCNGRSFDHVFDESYARAPIRKATAEQRRLWLLAAETASSKQDGSITLATDRRNRYWSAELADHAGEPLIVRFDPQTLHDRVYVYTLDSRFLCEAQCVQAAGFNDTEAAREHSRARNQFKRAARVALDAERRMDAIEAAKLLPSPAPASTPEAGVVRMFRGPASMRAAPPVAEPPSPEVQVHLDRLIAEQSQPQVVDISDSKEARYGRACALERRVSEGLPVDEQDRAWLVNYQTSVEYEAQKEFHESFGLTAEGQ